MKKKSDILVIGGGAIGVCCAHYLTQSGRQVILIEKGDIGCGASLGNAGLVIPGQSIPLAAPGMITKGLKWMRDPESPFYIKPRLKLDFLKWLWKFSRHCTAGHIRRVNAILKSIPLYLPDFDPRSLDLIEIWRGLRPCTPDGLPHIGRPNNLDNLIVATGHAMKGISLAPVTGKLVAQLAAGERPDINLSALNIERFT